MEKFWSSLCSDLNVDQKVGQEWSESVKKQYSEKHRFYHNVEFMLAKKLEFLVKCDNKAVVLATIFQNFHYDNVKNSTQENCDSFELFVEQAGIKDEKLVKTTLNLLGKESQEDEVDIDAKNLFQDIDLYIFGSTPDQYKTYCELLQKEYQDLESYKKMRLKLLQTFLMIPSIYSTSSFKEKFEDQARENIKNEIEELKKNPQIIRGRNHRSPPILKRRNAKRFKKFSANDSRLCETAKNSGNTIDLTNLAQPGTSNRIKPPREIVRTDEVICLDSDEEETSENFEETVKKILNESRVETNLQNSSLFFFDHGENLRNTEIPLYTISTAELVNPEETLNQTTITTTTQSQESDEENDDSVIFVDEVKLPPKPAENSTVEFGSQFIPLPKDKPKTNKKKRKSKKSTENSNSAGTFQMSQEQTVKRLVFLDGSNIAFAHGQNNEYSVKGIEICLDYFEKLGHEVKAIIPQFRLKFTRSTDPNRLNELKKQGKVVVTPGKDLGKNRKKCISYDDRFILEAAYQLSAAVISNDNFRDLIDEKKEFAEIIENRVIGFTFINDLLLIPPDPYGQHGPKTSEILNRKI